MGRQRQLPAPSDLVATDRVIKIAAFRETMRAFLQHSEEVANRWGLTPQRYLLLLMIKGAPDGSQRLSFTEIADRLKLSKNTVTELVARAEEAGIVQREPAEHDARVVYLRLTPEGERRLNGAIVESDEGRRKMATMFDELAATFRTARNHRPRRVRPNL